MVLNREITARIRDVLEKHPEGLSITDLVRSVDINRNTAGRYLENMLLSGQVEMRRFGMAKIYTLANRLPVSSVLAISPELVMQLDLSQRVVYANEPLLGFLGTMAKDLFGKNIEFTQFAIVFEDVFPGLLDRFRRGLRGDDWHGELSRPVRDRWFFCRVAPTVFAEGTKGVSILLEDISDQKRDEERIRKSESRLRSIIKVSPVGIGVAQDRVLLEVNDLFCGMTGYSPAELVGKPSRLLYVTDEEFDSVGIRQNDQMRQDGTCSLETRWRRKDGRVIDILLNSTPLDPANISGGITFTVLDITARKQAERALRESEDRYRSVFESTGTATAILEENTIVSMMNTEFERLSGYSRHEIEKKRSWTDFVVRKDLERMLAWHYQRREGGDAPRQYEAGVVRKDGEVRRALVTVGLIPGTTRSIVSIIDITDRKLMDEQFSQREQQYRFITENSLDIITRLSPDFTCQYISPAITPLLGYREMDMLGKSILPLIHPDDREQSRQTIEMAGREGSAQLSLTFRLRHQDGSYVWFDTTVRIVRDLKTGQVREFQGINRTITGQGSRGTPPGTGGGLPRKSTG